MDLLCSPVSLCMAFVLSLYGPLLVFHGCLVGWGDCVSGLWRFLSVYAYNFLNVKALC